MHAYIAMKSRLTIKLFYGRKMNGTQMQFCVANVKPKYQLMNILTASTNAQIAAVLLTLNAATTTIFISKYHNKC